MNTILQLDGFSWWQVTGWTMLHFLWLGTLVGLAAMFCRLLLRRVLSDTRYVLALASLAILAVLPVAIGAWLIAKSPTATTNTVPLAEQESIELSEIDAPPAPPSAPGFAGGTDTGNDIVVVDTPVVGEPTYPRQSRGLQAVSEILDACVPYLPWLWLIGTPLTFVLLATGLVGAERLRRGSRAITDGQIAETCARLRQSLGLSRQVAVAVCERIAAPVLVGILRPIILLPPAALTGWSPDEIEMVLLHELAHVRRWDNLVNLLQRLVESLLFFHPAVWLVSSWVRREREACCDVLVVHRTSRPHAYAEMLVALAAQMPRSVLFHPAASNAIAAGPLRSRIRRILQLEDDPMLISGKSFTVMLAGLLVAATLVVLYLPTVGQAEESNPEATEDTAPKSAAVPVDTNDGPNRPAAELPYVVRFEQGASRFLDGDNIKVVDVRGTARTFEPGNVYLIRGVYTLGSHDRAQLSAFTTATDAAHGKSQVWTIQTTPITQSEGTFELFLPMPYRGWPHVSFYPSDGGDGFGGTYFGTGDSVLKKWWGDGEDHNESTRNSATEARSASKGDAHAQTKEATTESAEKRQKNAQSESDRDRENLSGLTPLTFALKHDGSGELRLYMNGQPIGEDKVSDVIADQLKVNPDLEVVLSAEPGTRSADVKKVTKLFHSLGVRRIEQYAKLKSAFRVSEDNPISTRKYEVHPTWRQMMPHTFDAWRFDPYGPQLKFEAKWNADHSAIVVTAPKAAHKLVFSHLTDDDTAGTPWTHSSSATAPKPPAKFPSLEEQKLADQAWKALHLELSQISDDDLKRVQAMGYAGGVKVDATSAPMEILPGDVLVGLHVWPTRSIRDVVGVLNRDDLAELNPLKFYVVRPGAGKNQTGAFRAPEDDQVITGRITASVSAESSPRSQSQVGPQATASQVKQIIDRYDRLNKLSQDLEAVQDRLKQAYERNGKDDSQEISRLKRELRSLMQQYYEAAKQLGESSSGVSSAPRHVMPWDEVPKQVEAGKAADSPATARNKTNLRYEGKTFDEWRESWRTELSTEKRLEAIKALAAFGAAGAYVTEPSGMLLISATKLVPKSTHSIELFDGLLIRAKTDEPIAGVYSVDPQGEIDLGPKYGRMMVAGLTVAQARAAIKKQLAKWATNPQVTVSLAFTGNVQRVLGKHLIRPDGQIDLSTFGSVQVSGKTIGEVRRAIESKLADKFEDPQLEVEFVTKGRNYGKEAAEAILEVAPQYDWTKFNQNSDRIAALLQTSLSALGSRSYSLTEKQIPVKDSLPVIVAAAKSDDPRLRQAVAVILGNFARNEKQADDALLEMSCDADPKVRQLAFVLHRSVTGSKKAMIEYLKRVIAEPQSSEKAARAKAALEYIEKTTARERQPWDAPNDSADNPRSDP